MSKVVSHYQATCAILGLTALTSLGCSVEESPNESSANQVAEEALAGEEVTQVQQAYAIPSSTAHSNMVPAGYACVWNDEFESGLKPAWRPTNHDVNNEQQHYLDELNTADWNARTENGYLALRAKDEGYNKKCYQMGNCVPDGNTNGSANTKDKRYSSAKYTTKGLYSNKYGYIEVAFNLPRTRGAWPSVYLLSDNICEQPSQWGTCNNWPIAPEIDLFEYHNYNGVEAIQANVHYNDNGHKACDYLGRCTSSNSGSIVGDHIKLSLNNGFDGDHIVGVDWKDNSMTWYVDGQKQGTFNSTNVGSFDQNFFIALNLAVGGMMGGPTIDFSSAPGESQYMKYYYVRWYKYGATEACGLGSSGAGGGGSGGGTTATGSNLLSNSAFTSNMSGWTSAIVAPAAGVIKWDAYDGGIVKADLTAASTNAWDSKLYQDVALTAGVQYTMSARMRLAAAGSEQVNLVVQQANNSANKPLSSAKTISASTWSSFSGSFTPTVSATYRVQLSMGRADAGLRIDDVKLCAGSSCN